MTFFVTRDGTEVGSKKKGVFSFIDGLYLCAKDNDIIIKTTYKDVQ